MAGIHIFHNSCLSNNMWSQVIEASEIHRFNYNEEEAEDPNDAEPPTEDEPEFANWLARDKSRKEESEARHVRAEAKFRASVDPFKEIHLSDIEKLDARCPCCHGANTRPIRDDDFQRRKESRQNL